MDDVTFSEIKGKVTQTGEILGDVHLENVSGATHLHTSVTDMQVAELPGDLTLDSDDLHVNNAKGPVRVMTHSKDIDLSQIYGDSYVEDRDGHISVEPAGNYSVDAKTAKEMWRYRCHPMLLRRWMAERTTARFSSQAMP